MAFNYCTNEFAMHLPGQLQKDESINVIHFVTDAGEKRRVIISREILPEDASFESVTRNQIDALKKDKLITVSDVASMTISANNWPAIAIDVYAKIGKNHAWQFHVAFQWDFKYLITASLNAEGEISAEEKKDWVKTVSSFEFSVK